MPEGEHRFWDNVDRTGNCWEWLGSLQSAGYGQVRVDGERKLVHRFAYELLNGPIPEGLTLDHLCRNRRCVRPEHLEPVSIGENVLRGAGITARQARQGQCLRGHAFTVGNTYVTPDGRRQCRACLRLRYHIRKENAYA